METPIVDLLEQATSFEKLLIKYSILGEAMEPIVGLYI